MSQSSGGNWRCDGALGSVDVMLTFEELSCSDEWESMSVRSS